VSSTDHTRIQDGSYLICVAFIGMTPVPSAASASLPGSAIPSPSTSPSSTSPIVSAKLWPVLFAPLAVVLLVLLIVEVAIIVDCKQRRKNLNLKPWPSKGLPEDDSGIEKYRGLVHFLSQLTRGSQTQSMSHNSVVC